jgi:hypothetical protein
MRPHAYRCHLQRATFIQLQAGYVWYDTPFWDGMYDKASDRASDGLSSAGMWTRTLNADGVQVGQQR